MSQHEGRDAETTEIKQELGKDQVEILATNIVLRQLQKDPSIRIESIQETLDTLNNTYKKDVSMQTILEKLKEKGIAQKDNYVYAQGVLEEIEEEKEEAKRAEIEAQKALAPLQKKKLGKDIENFEEQLHGIEEKIELTALKAGIDETRARKILSGFASKKFIFLGEEILDRLSLKHAELYKVKYKYYNHKDAFHEGEAFINSLTGEFIHDDKGNIRESKGLPILLKLNEPETNILKLVAEKKRTAKQVSEVMRMEEGNAKRILDSLVKKGILVHQTDGKSIDFFQHANLDMDLPPTPLHDIIPSIGKRPITEVESAAVIPPVLEEKEIPELLKKLWGSITVKEVTHLFLPVWEGVLKKKTGEERTIMIDGINGKEIKLMK
jgi:predicted transcriptional regulator